MKYLMRLLALLLTITMILTCAVGAVDNGDLENAPDFLPSGEPDWSETELSITSGENTLAATLTVPDTAELDQQVPVVILVHGLNSSRKWCSDAAWALADQGIASIRFDLSGFSDSPETEVTMTLTSQIADILAVLDYAESLEFVDQSQIYLLGKSMGGVSSLLAAEERMDEIAGICLWYPGLGITDSVQHGYLIGTTFDPEQVPDTVTCYQYRYSGEFIRQCQDLDLKSVYSRITCPVLIVHGDRDRVAPIAYSKEAQQLLPDCELQVIPGGTHGFYGSADLAALKITGDWFSEQLAA